MTIRTVTSHVVNIHGAARAGDTVDFRLRDGIYTATEHAPQDVTSATIDASGDISVDLYCPANYHCTVADGMVFRFTLPDDPATPTTLEALHATSQAPPTAVNDVQVLLDTAALRGNNLSDLTNLATARTNLGVPSSADFDELATDVLYADAGIHQIEAYGAVANSTAAATANVIAINAAIAAAKAGSKRVGSLSGGVYSIDGTINITDCSGLGFDGGAAGIVGTAGGTILSWRGNATDPAVLVQDCRELHMRNLVIKAGSGFPLAEGIRSENGPGTTGPTANRYTNVMIDGTSGYVGIGWRYRLGSGGDNNNDLSVFDGCKVYNFGTGGGLFTTPAGWSYEHAQSKGHMHLNCSITGTSGQGMYGVTTALGAGGVGGSFTWIGGVISFTSEACFALGAPDDVISIRNVQSEHCGRFLTTLGPSSAVWPVSIEGVRYNSTGNYNADLKVIEYKHRGHLSIRNSIFEGPDSVAFTINMAAGGSTNYALTIEGVDIRTTLAQPFIFPSPITVVGSRVTLLRNHAAQSGGQTGLPDIITPTSTRTRTIPAALFTSGTGAPVTAKLGADGTQSLAYVLPNAIQSNVFALAELPADYYSGSVAIAVIWSGKTNPGAGEAVEWQVVMGSYADGEGMTTAPDTNSFLAGIVPATALLKLTSVVATNGFVVAGDLLRIEVKRLGAHANDTYTDDVYFWGVKVTYNANVVA